MNNINLSLWIRCITGHNNSAYFQSKLDPMIDPTCRLCQMEDETSFHLLTNCDALHDLRKNRIESMTIDQEHTGSINKTMTFLYRNRDEYDTKNRQHVRLVWNPFID